MSKPISSSTVVPIAYVMLRILNTGTHAVAGFRAGKADLKFQCADQGINPVGSHSGGRSFD